MGKLQFTFDVDPDANGVYDGRELAKQFIGAAFKLLVPYVDGCPACADNLMTAIANDVMEQLHEEGRQQGGLESGTYSTGDPASKALRVREHLDASKEETAAILGITGEGHTHH
ncbi:hypothetical protein [Caballeronia sp. TF1N1]|uniref:hypothetical protein n=1 Tax=Caballeronia sp. TF1N1 TaxID=2878153 RepID=UPI001FD36E43|nr:hypothetical protein [Caballeronia sp. TF1N1]